MTTQYTTFDEAKAVAHQIGDIGGGVMPFIAPDQDPDGKSGIYIPEYTQGPFRTPEDGDRKFYHLRFRNGADGFNAGLVKGTMTLFPTRWPLMLALEVNAAAHPTS